MKWRDVSRDTGRKVASIKRHKHEKKFSHFKEYILIASNQTDWINWYQLKHMFCSTQSQNSGPGAQGSAGVGSSAPVCRIRTGRRYLAPNGHISTTIRHSVIIQKERLELFILGANTRAVSTERTHQRHRFTLLRVGTTTTTTRFPLTPVSLLLMCWINGVCWESRYHSYSFKDRTRLCT